MNEPSKEERVLLQGANWKELRFFQKSEALYQMTFVFCERFLPKHGDRTVDQMVQAARSGKQNIIEGSEDGKTSTEMELKLLNVARSSIHELREDYKDYLLSRHLTLWDKQHPRYQGMHEFTKRCNKLSDYEPFFQKWNDEEMANTGYTMCCQIDVLMNGYLKTLEERFRKEGGMKERMYRVRTGYRAQQEQLMKEMQTTIRQQEERIRELEAELERMKRRLEDGERKRLRVKERKSQRDKESKRQKDKKTKRQRVKETKRQRDEETKRRRVKETKGRRDKGTKRRRDKETKSQRDKGTKRQRDKETKGQRDEESKRQRDEETKGRREKGTRRRNGVTSSSPPLHVLFTSSPHPLHILFTSSSCPLHLPNISRVSCCKTINAH